MTQAEMPLKRRTQSDPMAVVYTKGRDGALQEHGRTEVVLNSLNPSGSESIPLHIIWRWCRLWFRVYDVDTQFDNVDVKMLKLDEQHFLGEATCALSEIVTKSNKSVTLDLVRKNVSVGSNRPKNLGALTVHAEELVNSKTTTELILRFLDLESRNMFSNRILDIYWCFLQDPFLVISKIVESGISIPICKTEVLKNDLYLVWKPVFLNIQQVGSKGEEQNREGASLQRPNPKADNMLTHRERPGTCIGARRRASGKLSRCCGPVRWGVMLGLSYIDSGGTPRLPYKRTGPLHLSTGLFPSSRGRNKTVRGQARSDPTPKRTIC
ncbi:hypothetical protein ACSBR2_023645 [Camellia fascicularis]